LKTYFWLRDEENGQSFRLLFLTPLPVLTCCGLSHNAAGDSPNPSETNRENHREHFRVEMLSFGNEYFKLVWHLQRLFPEQRWI